MSGLQNMFLARTRSRVFCFVFALKTKVL